MLACHIAHVVRFFVYRVTAFRKDITHQDCGYFCQTPHITDANQLFDNYQMCRAEASKLCDGIDFVTDWFPLSLLLAITFQVNKSTDASSAK